jgi:hypothetical protein
MKDKSKPSSALEDAIRSRKAQIRKLNRQIKAQQGELENSKDPEQVELLAYCLERMKIHRRTLKRENKTTERKIRHNSKVELATNGHESNPFS